MGYATRSKSGPPAAATIAKKPAPKKPAPKKPASKPAKRAGNADPAPKTAKGSLKTFPDVKVLVADGSEKTSAVAHADGPAIVFLYPRANTPGCTTQAKGLRDAFEDVFKPKGFSVWGCSYDAPKSQCNWRDKHQMPFDFLCDKLDGNLISKLGCGKGDKGIKRSHFIVGKDGSILDAQIGVSPKDSIAKAVDFVKAFDGGDTVDAMQTDEVIEDKKKVESGKSAEEKSEGNGNESSAEEKVEKKSGEISGEIFEGTSDEGEKRTKKQSTAVVATVVASATAPTVVASSASTSLPAAAAEAAAK